MRVVVMAVLTLVTAACGAAQGHSQAAAGDPSQETITNSQGRTVYIRTNRDGTFTARDAQGHTQTGSRETIDRIFQIESQDPSQVQQQSEHHVDDNFNDTE